MRRSTTTARGCRFELVLALAACLAACGDDGEGGRAPDGGISPDGGEEPPEETSQIRFVHASPDAPALDVFPAGEEEPLVEDLEFGESSPNLELEPGSRAFALRSAGDPQSEPLLTTDPLDLQAGAESTAIAAGALDGEEEQAFRVVTVTEGFVDPGFERAVVRVVHLAPEVPAANFDIGDDGDVEIEELALFEATAAGGIPVPAGQRIQLEVQDAEWGAHVTTFTIPALEQGEERLLLVIGRSEGLDPGADRALSLLALGPERADRILQNPALQALHAVPDAPAVDVNADGDLLVWNLEFAELSGARQVPPGELELSLRANASGESLGAVTTSELEAGERYLVVASGFATPQGEEPGLRAIAAREAFPAGESAPMLAGVHAIPDAPAFDVSTVEGGLLTTPPLVEGVAFGEATEPISVSIGTLDIGAAREDTRGPQVRFEITTAEEQRTFSVFAGALTPRWDEEFPRTIVIDATSFPWSLAGAD